MSDSENSPIVNGFVELHRGLPRQGPGSDTTTRRLLELARPLPGQPRVLDLGCGPGRASLLLAAEAGAEVTAVDLHRPFLDELERAAAERGLSPRIRTVHRSMADLPYPDRSFDAVWAEGSAYNLGFDTALRSWRRLLAEDGVLVATECEWATEQPSARARAFWERTYPLRTAEENAAAAREAGYRVAAVLPLPDEDWFDEYYTPLAERIAAADPAVPGMAEAAAAAQKEIELRQSHGEDYRYTGYVLRPDA